MTQRQRCNARASAAHVMAGAVLVRPADELHGRTLWRVTVPAQQTNHHTFNHLEIVGNAVLQRLVGRCAAHKRRDGAPQRRPIGPNKREPEQTALFNTQKQFKMRYVMMGARTSA